MKQYILLFLIVLALTACSGSTHQAQSARSSNELTNHVWVLKKVLSDTIRNEPSPFILFTDTSSFNGFGGCNTFTGRYSLARNKIHVADLNSTLIACDASTPEEKFFTLLRQIDGYQLKGKRLLLTKDDHEIMQLEEK